MAGPKWETIVEKFLNETDYYSFLASDPIYVENVFLRKHFVTGKKIYASLEDSQLYHSLDFLRLGKEYHNGDTTKEKFIERGKQVAKLALSVHIVEKRRMDKK